jgi:hypothetical protein
MSNDPLNVFSLKQSNNIFDLVNALLRLFENQVLRLADIKTGLII